MKLDNWSQYQNVLPSQDAHALQQASTSYYVDFARNMGMSPAKCESCGDVLGIQTPYSRLIQIYSFPRARENRLVRASNP